MDDFIDIGAQCFTDTDEKIISYKGENYYKSCPELVADLPDGGQSFCVKRVGHPGYIHEDFDGRTRTEDGDSNLIKHARREMELIGEDPDVVEWMLRTVAEFASYGHSGGSAGILIFALHDLLQVKNLTPLTDDPKEWIHHGEDVWPPDGIWQNSRNPEAFSRDEGKTYYLLSEGVKDGEPEIWHKSKLHNPVVIIFKRDRNVIKCDCGEFELNLLQLDEDSNEAIKEHAKSHNGTSISIIDQF